MSKTIITIFIFLILMNISAYTQNNTSAEEKYIKGKSRNWKEGLIKEKNPTLKDLWDEIQDW